MCTYREDKAAYFEGVAGGYETTRLQICDDISATQILNIGTNVIRIPLYGICNGVGRLVEKALDVAEEVDMF